MREGLPAPPECLTEVRPVNRHEKQDAGESSDQSPAFGASCLARKRKGRPRRTDFPLFSAFGRRTGQEIPASLIDDMTGRLRRVEPRRVDRTRGGQDGTCIKSRQRGSVGFTTCTESAWALAPGSVRAPGLVPGLVLVRAPGLVPVRALVPAPGSVRALVPAPGLARVLVPAPGLRGCWCRRRGWRGCWCRRRGWRGCWCRRRGWRGCSAPGPGLRGCWRRGRGWRGCWRRGRGWRGCWRGAGGRGWRGRLRGPGPGPGLARALVPVPGLVRALAPGLVRVLAPGLVLARRRAGVGAGVGVNWSAKSSVLLAPLVVRTMLETTAVVAVVTRPAWSTSAPRGCSRRGPFR